ncbi:hypothetical protein EON65_56245 [archaeon]|nr:MAG: hypothetical protein EON65_56245 [archaeon]
MIFSFAQIPCDEAYGQHCPEASGFEVGECLKNLDPSQLSEECKNFIVIHDLCREDITKHCTGNEYTGDLLGKQAFLSVFVFHPYPSQHAMSTNPCYFPDQLTCTIGYRHHVFVLIYSLFVRVDES